MRRRAAFQPEAEGRATAFPSGDLPEPPGGPKRGRPEPRRNGAGCAFSAAGPKSGPALHRETKCFPAAILRFAAALRVRRVSVPGLGSP